VRTTSIETSRPVLVTGAAGMLGSEILLRAPSGAGTIGTDLRPGPGVDAPAVDLADRDAVVRLFEERGPFSGAIHTAAFTAVDLAEEKEADALRANAEATRVLAEACARARIPLVALSTDFVFDGNSSRPYREDDATRPLGAYGRTKLAGERAALEAHPSGARIVRTQWLYGPRGKHFPGTIRELARKRKELKVIQDQTGSPTTTLELAPAVWDVLLRGEPGIWHAACEGSCSWYDLAVATLELCGVQDVRVVPCATHEYPLPARRPAYSVLDSTRLATLRGRKLAPWRKALQDFLAANPL
jgi:dTDP-4-dehydrorhamnose reductase